LEFEGHNEVCVALFRAKIKRNYIAELLLRVSSGCHTSGAFVPVNLAGVLVP
jgi:hypothetical protein